MASSDPLLGTNSAPFSGTHAPTRSLGIGSLGARGQRSSQLGSDDACGAAERDRKARRGWWPGEGRTGLCPQQPVVHTRSLGAGWGWRVALKCHRGPRRENDGLTSTPAKGKMGRQKSSDREDRTVPFRPHCQPIVPTPGAALRAEAAGTASAHLSLGSSLHILTPSRLSGASEHPVCLRFPSPGVLSRSIGPHQPLQPSCLPHPVLAIKTCVFSDFN